jgi:putative endonuclease
MNAGSVYILGNVSGSSLYIGVTNNVETRILQHKCGIGSAFTKKYQLKILLYYEKFETITDAIAREKQLKNWRREWKLNLIKEENPLLNDLAENWYTESDFKGVLGL